MWIIAIVLATALMIIGHYSIVAQDWVPTKKGHELSLALGVVYGAFIILVTVYG